MPKYDFAIYYTNGQSAFRDYAFAWSKTDARSLMRKKIKAMGTPQTGGEYKIMAILGQDELPKWVWNQLWDMHDRLNHMKVAMEIYKLHMKKEFVFEGKLSDQKKKKWGNIDPKIRNLMVKYHPTMKV